MSKFCNNCGNNKFVYKKVFLHTKNFEKEDFKSRLLDILPMQTDEFYLRICPSCGKVEFFLTSVIESVRKEVLKSQEN